MRRHFLVRSLGIVLVAAVACAMLVNLSPAAKPGGGGGGGTVPAGRITYHWRTPIQIDNGSEWLGYWSMNADGSDKQLLADVLGLPSYQLHGGHRWYLTYDWSPTPGNGVALYAVRDDGDPNFTVLLADPTVVSLGHYLANCRWSKDDAIVSVSGMPLVTNPDGTKSYDPDGVQHIYAAFLTFDPETGLPALATPFVEVLSGEEPGRADIENHDWSPDGSQIVYELHPNASQPSAKIASLADGSTRVLATMAYNPIWSPDGSRIAYKKFDDGIYVVSPDGSGQVAITSFPSGRSDYTVQWSPDGSEVLIDRMIVKSVKGGYTEYHSDILRVPAAGGKAINLTGDIDGYARAMFWR